MLVCLFACLFLFVYWNPTSCTYWVHQKSRKHWNIKNKCFYSLTYKKYLKKTRHSTGSIKRHRQKILCVFTARLKTIYGRMSRTGPSNMMELFHVKITFWSCVWYSLKYFYEAKVHWLCYQFVAIYVSFEMKKVTGH